VSDETTEARPERALPPSFGPKPGHLRKAEIKRQIEGLVWRLLQRVNLLEVSLRDSMTAELYRIERVLGAMLSSPEPSAREVGAGAVARSLLDVGELESPEWWCTDLGRAVAREIGYIAPAVPRAVARNILHVSRQAIDQMIARGALDTFGGHTPPAVTRESVCRAAAARWPRESDV
jgi:hypothetical protein